MQNNAKQCAIVGAIWRRTSGGLPVLLILTIVLMVDVSQFRRLSSPPELLPPPQGEENVQKMKFVRSTIMANSTETSTASQALRSAIEMSPSYGQGFPTRNELDTGTVDAAKANHIQLPPGEGTILPLSKTNMDVIVQGKSYSLEATDLPSTILPLPMPVFVVGLPKAGTTTIHAFFQSAKYKSGHWELVRAKIDPDNLIGICMRKALYASRSLLKDCGNFDVWAQMDAIESPEHCVFPQISYLEELHREAPNATLILNRRNLEKWASSVVRWQGGKPEQKRKSLSERLVSCPGVGPIEQTEEAMIEWHLNHIKRIREFVKEHPSHALLEIDIDDPKTADRMAQAFKVPSKYWGHANHNPSISPPGEIGETTVAEKQS